MTIRNSHARCRLTLTAWVALSAGACGGDDPASPGSGGGTELPIVWTFDAGLEGWDPSEQCNGNPECYPVGFVTQTGGMVILEGAGEPDFPNSSISRALTLPAGTATFSVRAISSCTGTPASDTEMLIRIGVSGSPNVLEDGAEVGELWETVSVDVSEFAGEPVVIYVEQNDNGEQEDFASPPEALCIDEVTITGTI